MSRDEFARLVREAAEAAMRSGALPQAPLPEIVIERPRLPEHGDYSSNIAMRLQRAVGGNPAAIAEAIRAHLPAAPIIGTAEVARPGFINFRMSDRWLAAQVEAIRRAGAAFAGSAAGAGVPVQVEFVSANPTGPLTVGNGRGAAIGSTLANVLEAHGHRVQREYYVNDAGTQVGVFGQTLYARYAELYGRTVEIPADGYPGEYVIDVARRLKAEHGDRFLRPEGEPAPAELGELGIAYMVDGLRADLEAVGVTFDRWFSERSLYVTGQYEQAMAILRQHNVVSEREGAVWFTSTDIGEDKDNVLIRSTGAPTYFASDIAYHYDKFQLRGFKRVINVWGADHHGHVSRLKAAVQAIGGDPDALTIVLYQLVTVRRGGEVVRLSKRAGEIILLRDLVEEVGRDACRFFFLQRSADSTLDFDIDLAKTQSDKNPVFYVQYSHARIAGILRRAGERGLSPEGGDVALLIDPAELALVRKMLQLPELLDQIARTLEPHHLTYYAMDLAATFHAFYRDVPVLTRGGRHAAEVPEALSRARLKLVEAAKIALARTLTLMGMSTPEMMERREAALAEDEEADEE